jgi:hypothetical protein
MADTGQPSDPTALSTHTHTYDAGGSYGGDYSEGGTAAFGAAPGQWDVFLNRDNTPISTRGLWNVCDATSCRSSFYLCGAGCPIGTTTAQWAFKAHTAGFVSYGGWGGGCTYSEKSLMVWKCPTECCFHYAVTYSPWQINCCAYYHCCACTNGTAHIIKDLGTPYQITVWVDCISICFIGGYSNHGGLWIQSV